MHIYSIYYILYVLCLYIIDLTVQFHCYTVIEMLLQFTVIIAKVAPSIATKTGLRESPDLWFSRLCTRLYVFSDHGPNKAFLLLLLLLD